MPKVDVIIPTYNCSKYVTGAIDSILNQTFQDFEIIVIDDGSTDNTNEVLRPYLDKINYIYQENHGPAAARNVGILKSNAKYIAFLDSDDIWYPQKLEYQVRCLEANPRMGLVFSNADKFNDQGALEGTKLDKVKIPEVITFDKLLYQNYIQTSTVMIRRECIENIEYFDEHRYIAEDYELWLRIARKYFIKYLNMSLAKYRFRPESLTGDIKRVKMKVLDLIMKICHDYPDVEIKYKGIIRKARANLFFEIGYDYFSKNAITKSRKYFSTSLQYNPFRIATYKYLFYSLFPGVFIKKIRYIKQSLYEEVLRGL